MAPGPDRRHSLRTIDWVGGRIELVDQTRLPHEERLLQITRVDELIDAIQRLAVRGAPALGAAGIHWLTDIVAGNGQPSPIAIGLGLLVVVYALPDGILGWLARQTNSRRSICLVGRPRS